MYRHHEQSTGVQNKFKKDISNLEEEFRKHSSLFQSRDSELIHLVSNDVCGAAAMKKQSKQLRKRVRKLIIQRVDQA